jgi:spore coat-associated protein N
MKKILSLSIVALMVIGLVAGGTWAFFSDTESSTDNEFSAGTLDLTIEEGNVAVTMFSVTDKVPGESGSASADLANVGNTSGELDISISNYTSTESTGSTEYESDDIGGEGVGELGGVLTIAMYIDVDESGTWTSGDIGLKSDETTYTYSAGEADLQYAAVSAYDGDEWDAVLTMAAAATDDLVVLWDIPTSADNTIQGDSLSFDISFVLEQAAAD